MSAPAPPIPARPLHDEGLELAPELLARIAADLRPLRPGPVLSRLGRRAEASVAASRGFLTVRREAHRFESPAPGVRRQRLRTHPAVKVELLALDAGAALPWDGQSQELLVLDGGLVDTSGRCWATHEHLLRTAAAPALQAGPHGARLYQRTLLDAQALPADEAAWWVGEDERYANDWWTLSPGVEVKRLRGREDVLSMLVRMRPGAVLGDHGHRLEEDCLMLSGELFLGDILLRTDDYHLAPAGPGMWTAAASPAGCCSCTAPYRPEQQRAEQQRPEQQRPEQQRPEQQRPERGRLSCPCGWCSRPRCARRP